MRRFPVMPLLAVCLAVSSMAQMRFTLESGKQQYRTGEPIRLTWKLYNGTSQSWVVYKATVGARENFPQIAIDIRGPSGRQNLTLQGSEFATVSRGCRLPPG